MKVNPETIQRLFLAYHDDHEAVEMIEDAFQTFEQYHKAIMDLEIKRKLFAWGVLSPEEYREQYPILDKSRTFIHNSLLAQVNILNRLAAKADLPPFYDGIVSEERPYRREVANAVLDYLQQIIDERC